MSTDRLHEAMTCPGAGPMMMIMMMYMYVVMIARLALGGLAPAAGAGTLPP